MHPEILQVHVLVTDCIVKNRFRIRIPDEKQGLHFDSRRYLGFCLSIFLNKVQHDTRFVARCSAEVFCADLLICLPIPNGKNVFCQFCFCRRILINPQNIQMEIGLECKQLLLQLIDLRFHPLLQLFLLRIGQRDFDSSVLRPADRPFNIIEDHFVYVPVIRLV